MGDYALLLALPLFVYQFTGSTLAASVMFMTYRLPGVLLGSIAGVFADRWDRKRMLVFANPLQALALLPLLAVRGPEHLWIVYTSGFASAAIGRFVAPAENALLPTLVGEEHLVPANALNALNNNLARLLGPPLAGLLVDYVGLAGAALVDAATFLIAGALIALIDTPAKLAEDTVEDTQSAASAWVRTWREWLDGLRLVGRNRQLRGVFATVALAALADGMINVLWVPFVYKVLGRGPVEFGWFGTAQAIGGIAGSVVIARLAQRLGLRALIVLSAAATGALDLLLFNIPILPLDLAFQAGNGAAIVGLGTGITALIQRDTADRYRGRVSGAEGATNTLLGLVGLGLAGMLEEMVGAVPLLTLAGGLLIVSALVARLLLRDDAAEMRLAAAEAQETPAPS